MFAENDVVENTTNAEHVTNWMGLGCHVFYVNDFRSYIPRSSTSYEKIVGVVSYRCQSEVNYDRLFAQNDVVRF